MDDTPTTAPPATREACRARLAEPQDQIAAIKAEIAAVDLDRQARRGKADARWFHRTKTALRLKQREAAELNRHLGSLPGRKDALKDTLLRPYLVPGEPMNATIIMSFCL